MRLFVTLLLLASMLAGCSGWPTPHAGRASAEGATAFAWLDRATAVARVWDQTTGLAELEGRENTAPDCRTATDVGCEGYYTAMGLEPQHDDHVGDGLAPAWRYRFDGVRGTQEVLVSAHGDILGNVTSPSTSMQSHWRVDLGNVSTDSDTLVALAAQLSDAVAAILQKGAGQALMELVADEEGSHWRFIVIGAPDHQGPSATGQVVLAAGPSMQFHAPIPIVREAEQRTGRLTLLGAVDGGFELPPGHAVLRVRFWVANGTGALRFREVIEGPGTLQEVEVGPVLGGNDAAGDLRQVELPAAGVWVVRLSMEPPQGNGGLPADGRIAWCTDGPAGDPPNESCETP